MVNADSAPGGPRRPSPHAGGSLADLGAPASRAGARWAPPEAEALPEGGSTRPPDPAGTRCALLTCTCAALTGDPRVAGSARRGHASEGSKRNTGDRQSQATWRQRNLLQRRQNPWGGDGGGGPHKREIITLTGLKSGPQMRLKSGQTQRELPERERK